MNQNRDNMRIFFCHYCIPISVMPGQEVLLTWYCWAVVHKTHAWFPNVLQCEYHAETHTHTYFKWWSSLNNKNSIIISNHFISSIYIKRCISHSVNLSVCPLLFEGKKHSLNTEGRTKFLHTWGDKNVW